MRKLIGLGVLAIALPMAAEAAPKIDPAFGDHAVIQRDRAILVTGTAEAGETVTVRLADRSAKVRAGADGRFAAPLPPLSSGEPLTLVVEARSGRTTATDILIGDVFLCSGQSNMEFPVERSLNGAFHAQMSADDKLRLMTVGKTTALTPQASFAEAPAWVVAAPDTAPSFSAACFFMAQELRKMSGVPIGAIASSWGGTQVSAWMGDAAQRAAGRGAEADLLRLYAADPAAASRQAGAPWEKWWRSSTGDAEGREPWRTDSALDWKSVPRIDVWESWGVPELAVFNGMVWFRREVTLTATQAAQAAVLAIGPVDDMDRTWVNGMAAGAGGNPGTPREYALPAGMLHAGRNVIVVNANDVYANGGMHGPAEIMKLTFADGSSMPLGEGWTYAVESRRPPNPPRVPWDDVAGAGTIYNAMVAPLGPIGLKGVAWYQGESDTDFPGYAARLGAMMADWRRQFAQPALPFVIVQLPGFGAPALQPGESGWARLREDQRQTVLRDRRAALAVAIDLGDPADIHPAGKREIGVRLGRAMSTLAYGAEGPPSGPAVASAVLRPDGGVEVRFSGVSGGLHSRSSASAIGFELCDAAGACRYALGTPDGDRVTLAGDGRPVAKVRYAWADSPSINLFDEASLPVGPFEIAVTR